MPGKAQAYFVRAYNNNYLLFITMVLITIMVGVIVSIIVTRAIYKLNSSP
ncbi:hypothetical protein [Vulcanisaeta souniana]|nr:hypothetical protein [Vulcanisaeta souniana]